MAKKKSGSAKAVVSAAKRAVAKAKAKVEKFVLKEMAAKPFAEAVAISRKLFALQVEAQKGSVDPKSDMSNALGIMLGLGAKLTKLSIDEFVLIATEIAKRASKVK